MEIKLANFGYWELILILLIAAILFGTSKLPNLGDALGKSIRNFRKSYKEQPRETHVESHRLDESSKPERLTTGKNSSKGKESAHIHDSANRSEGR